MLDSRRFPDCLTSQWFARRQLRIIVSRSVCCRPGSMLYPASMNFSARLSGERRRRARARSLDKTASPYHSGPAVVRDHRRSSPLRGRTLRSTRLSARMITDLRSDSGAPHGGADAPRPGAIAIAHAVDLFIAQWIAGADGFEHCFSPQRKNRGGRRRNLPRSARVPAVPENRAQRVAVDRQHGEKLLKIICWPSSPGRREKCCSVSGDIWIKVL